MKRAWLKHVDWPTVVGLNAQLCAAAGALHKPTSDGYEETTAGWNENYRRKLSLAEAVDFCRRCHRMAPFCNFNGNTFVAIIRDCISHAPDLNREQIAIARSLAGHIVAGTAEPEEKKQFEKLLNEIDRPEVNPPDP